MEQVMVPDTFVLTNPDPSTTVGITLAIVRLRRAWHLVSVYDIYNFILNSSQTLL